MIRFSIITVCYNAAACLPHTLDSVMEQTYPYVEHVIIDGCSTDGSIGILEKYREQAESDENNFHDVHIVSEPDRGLYDAMNKGLAKAQGDYVLFLNAGDAFPSSGTLDMVVSSIADGEILPAVIYGDTDIVDGNYQFLCHRRLSPPEELTWRSFLHGMVVCHQAFYARTDIARSIPYDMTYRYSADVDWCIKVMKEAGRQGLSLRYCHALVANYLKEGQSTIHHRASLVERFHVMRKHYGLLPTVVMHLWFVIRSII